MLTENEDYYFNDRGLMVFTEKYHLDRGYCCKNKCLNCPWKYGRLKPSKPNQYQTSDALTTMELEKEIGSNKFDSNSHKALVNIIYTYGWVTTRLRERFDKYDVTMQQYNILRILRGQHPKPATINMLKERMLDKMSDASRIVERLVLKGFVTRCVNNNDRRAVDVLISDKGLGLLTELDAEVQANNIFSTHLSEKEAEQLSTLLDKLRG